VSPDTVSHDCGCHDGSPPCPGCLRRM
jgi:hypothetical protein